MYLSNPYIRINKLEIRNYRGIDELRIEFPFPVMDYDSDIMVIGGRNGIGKTSVLECSAILALLTDEDEGEYFIDSHKITPEVDLSGLIIRSGADDAVISGEIEYKIEEKLPTESSEKFPEELKNNQDKKNRIPGTIIKEDIKITIRRNNTIRIEKTGNRDDNKDLSSKGKHHSRDLSGPEYTNSAYYNAKNENPTQDKTDKTGRISETNTTGYITKKFSAIRNISGNNEINKNFYTLINAICGSDPNPLIENGCLFFHNLRRIAPGNPQIKDTINSTTYKKDNEVYSDVSAQNSGKKELNSHNAEKSSFKSEILRTIMKQTDIFEYDSKSTAENNKNLLKLLNVLLNTYAGAEFSKLRPTEENTMEIRIAPLNGDKSYSVDCLGSGEKDIVSMLFMLYSRTSEKPAIVLIDEPEMHLNPGWHRSFMNRIIELAPDNQYIITTNSEYIMDSVEKKNRIILISGKDEQ